VANLLGRPELAFHQRKFLAPQVHLLIQAFKAHVFIHAKEFEPAPELRKIVSINSLTEISDTKEVESEETGGGVG
jgi:hypothetical protein